MGGTYEEGHMLTFKIILLVILGSAGNKQNKTAAGRSLYQHQKYPHCPLLVVVWYRITPYFDVFFRKMGSIIHRASQKKHWEEIFPKLEDLSENIARIANAVQVTM